MLDCVINAIKFPGWSRSSHLEPGALLWCLLTFLGQTSIQSGHKSRMLVDLRAVDLETIILTKRSRNF